MMKLHGMDRSNYYCLVKAALLEKRMDFEAVAATPSQDENYLRVSPMGRVPCLETRQGFISESFAILEYLEMVKPAPALFPTDAFERAKVIELIRHVELNVELVARRCLPAAFFGVEASAELKASTRQDLERGMRAVDQLLVADPYAAGSVFTAADLYVFYTFGLASSIVDKVFNEVLLDGHEALTSLMTRLAERDCIRQVEAAKSS